MQGARVRSARADYIVSFLLPSWEGRPPRPTNEPYNEPRMRRTLFLLTTLFFLVAIASPLRFAYADAPQTGSMTAAANAIESSLHSFSASLASLPHRMPPLNISAIWNAGQPVFHATIAAASHTLAQAASAWSAWVSLANADLTPRIKVASVPSTAAVIVSQRR